MQNNNPKTVTVVVSTYNNPKWLKKTLQGYLFQSRVPNEIIIADDGSKEETKKVIDDFRTISPCVVKHIWHNDDGFRKCIILNKAILQIKSEYVIFADQDCVPRADFVEAHCNNARNGYFLSGGVVFLNMKLSEEMSCDDLKSGIIFDLKYLKSKGYKTSFKSSKLVKCRFFTSLMNYITTTKATWNGGNASTWVINLLTVNGYNNSMAYGGEDRELGDRLGNMGIKGKQIRYSAICFHLDHSRPYKNLDIMKKNNEIRKNTITTGLIETPDGIKQLINYHDNE